MTLEQEIMQILADTRDEIRANMDEKGINASGRTSASLRVQADGRGMRLVGGGGSAAPIPTLEFGREGGKVPQGFYRIIKQWTVDKGLSFASEQERSTFAYFLSRKIAREGTHRNKVHEDVYSTPVTSARARIDAAIKANMTNTIRAAIMGTNVQTLQGAFT